MQAIFAKLLEEGVLDMALNYVVPMVQLGMNRDEIAKTMQGWADQGFTIQQMDEATLALRKAERDDATRA